MSSDILPILRVSIRLILAPFGSDAILRCVAFRCEITALDHFRVAFKHLKLRTFSFASEVDTEFVLADPKVFYGQIGQPCRKRWIDVQPAVRRIRQIWISM